MIVPTLDEFTRMSVTLHFTGGGGPWAGKTQGSLHLELERLVDREDEVVAPDGRLEPAQALGDVPAGGVLLHDQLAGLAGQLLLVGHLEAGQAVIVQADGAEERRGQSARRVEPLRL